MSRVRMDIRFLRSVCQGEKNPEMDSASLLESNAGASRLQQTNDNSQTQGRPLFRRTQIRSIPQNRIGDLFDLFELSSGGKGIPAALAFPSKMTILQLFNAGKRVMVLYSIVNSLFPRRRCESRESSSQDSVLLHRQFLPQSENGCRMLVLAV